MSEHSLRLTVNGQPHSITVPANRLLVHVLRARRVARAEQGHRVEEAAPLVHAGRVGHLSLAIAQGQLIAWGRKPRLGFKFRSLIRNP